MKNPIDSLDVICRHIIQDGEDIYIAKSPRKITYELSATTLYFKPGKGFEIFPTLDIINPPKDLMSLNRDILSVANGLASLVAQRTKGLEDFDLLTPDHHPYAPEMQYFEMKNLLRDWRPESYLPSSHNPVFKKNYKPEIMGEAL